MFALQDDGHFFPDVTGEKPNLGHNDILDGVFRAKGLLQTDADQLILTANIIFGNYVIF